MDVGLCCVNKFKVERENGRRAGARGLAAAGLGRAKSYF